MNPIDNAILLDEIRKALNILLKSGQVGHTETELTEILSETNVEYNDGDGIEVSATIAPLVVGNTYKVLWDGVPYICTAILFDGFVYIGNLIATDGADTGEPFGVAFRGKRFNIFSVRDEDTHTCSIKAYSETIHPIDPKFLPGVCLPVVLDLTKYDANGPSLNDLVLSLFSIGGGKTSVNNTDGTQAFWKDVNTDGRIQLMIDANSVKLVSDVKSTTLEPDGTTIIAIETSFLITLVENTARVTVMFGALSHTTDITLVVEFLTIPG